MNSAIAFLKLKNPMIQRWYFLLWAWLIPAVILFVLSFKLWVSPFSIFQLLNSISWYYLIVEIALLPLNVWLEAAKWRFLIVQWKPVTLMECVKVILAGKSLNAISPLGLGEAFAKYTQLEYYDFDKSIMAIALARMTQMIPTLIFGCFSVYYLIQAGFKNTEVLLVFISFMLLILGLLLMLVIGNKKVNQWSLKYYIIAKSIKRSAFFKVIVFSFLRYAVFSIQFLLIFYWVGVDLDFIVAIQGVFWIFFIKSIVPNVSVLGDLANRELSSFAFFSLFLVDLQMISFANFCIWLINIILPALLGLAFVRNVRITSK